MSENYSIINRNPYTNNDINNNNSMFMYNNQIMQNNKNGEEFNNGMRLYYRGIKQKEDLKKYL